MIKRFLIGAETGLGIVLALTPVTFWVAWTPSLLFGAMAVAVASALLLALLHNWTSSLHEVADPGRQSGSAQPVLPEGFMEQIHQIFPLTYHHSRTASARYRRAMENLRRLLGS